MSKREMMSKDTRSGEDILDRVDRLERDLDIMRKNAEPVSCTLDKLIGARWKCCSCGKERFFAIEKPAKKYEVDERSWTWWIYLCDDCSKAFG